MEQWEAALIDRKAGMKYKEIAEKYGVTESAVKSWAKRYWNSKVAKKVAPKDAKKLQLSHEAMQPKKNGAPYGNQNARGNKGGAPIGSSNALIHGAYSKKYLSNLSDDDQALIDTIPGAGPEELLYTQLQDLTLKAQYLKRKIAELDRQDTGLCVDSVTTTRIKGGKPFDTTSTTARPILDAILKLEAELDRTQGRITNVIKALMHHQEERTRLILERERLRIMAQRAAGYIDTSMLEAKEGDVVEVDDTLLMQATAAAAGPGEDSHGGT